MLFSERKRRWKNIKSKKKKDQEKPQERPKSQMKDNKKEDEKCKQKKDDVDKKEDKKDESKTKSGSKEILVKKKVLMSDPNENVYYKKESAQRENYYKMSQ